MKDFEFFLSHIPFHEYVLMGGATWIAYILLKPFDWDSLRGWSTGIFFLLLLTIKYLTGISYCLMLWRYVEVEFIQLWIITCIAVFYFFLTYSYPLRMQVLRRVAFLAMFLFLFLFLLKQVVE